jgi:hypothetical protein
MGQASFLVHGGERTLRGRMSQTSGQLDLDLSDLTRSRGKLSIDPRSALMNSFEEDEANREQNAVVQGLVAGAGNVEFSVREVTRAEPRALAATDAAQGTARLSATGDLTWRGTTVTLPVELELTVAFRGTAPQTLQLRTIKDVLVPIRPASELGDSASVAVELAAQAKK